MITTIKLWYQAAGNTAHKATITMTLLLCYAAPTYSSFFAPQAEQQKLFSGSIQLTHKIAYDLCLFYKGEKIIFDPQIQDNSLDFSFVDDKSTHCIYVIITDAVTHNTEHANTLQSLQIADESKYICYKLQAKRQKDDQNQDLLTWDSIEHKLEQNIIPENSLIFLFNPHLIAGLKVPSWQSENVFRLVPTILIDPQSSVAELQRAMVVARLSALDIDPVHRKKTTAINNPTSAILTVMQ